MKRKLSVLLLLVMLLNTFSTIGMFTALADDTASVPEANAVYVTPTGAGRMDGSSWENAMRGDMEGGLQAAWDKAPANGSVYVGSGTYTTIQQLKITGENDGISESEMKRLIGVDTGAGKPKFVGRYQVGDIKSGKNQDTLISMIYTTTTPVPIETSGPTEVPLPEVEVKFVDNVLDSNFQAKYTNYAAFEGGATTDLVVKAEPNTQLYLAVDNVSEIVTLDPSSDAYIPGLDAYSVTKALGLDWNKANKTASRNFRVEPLDPNDSTIEAALAMSVGESVKITATPAPDGGEAGDPEWVINPDSIKDWTLLTEFKEYTITLAKNPTVPEGAVVLFADDFQSDEYELVNPKRNGVDNETYTDPTGVQARSELANMGWIATENTSHYGIVKIGSNKMLKVVKTFEQNANIYKTFTPVQVATGTVADGTLVANANGKLVMEYDINISSDSGSKRAYWGLAYGEQGNSARTAGYYYTGNGNTKPLYYIQNGSNGTIIPQFANGSWMHVKQIINIKDANGNYKSTVDTYIDGVPVALGRKLSSAATIADRFYINTTTYVSGTGTLQPSSRGVTVDNMVAYYYEEASAEVTEAPQPTLMPTATPKPTTPEPAPNLTGCGASYIEIANLRIDNYFYNIKTNGKNIHLVFHDIESYYSSDVFYLQGGATTKYPEEGIRDVEIYDCYIYGNAKRGVRTRDGIDGLLCRNIYVDMGGRELWAAENWPTGFGHGDNQEGVKDKNITLVDCFAKDPWHEADPGDYWNSDGVATAGDVENFTNIRCFMYGSTDGGWDCKGKNIELIDCIGMDNKKNFRLWGNTTMTNCLSAYSVLRGGGGGTQGFWTKGQVVMNNCTFYNNASTHLMFEGDGTLEANNCIFVTDNGTDSWVPSTNNITYKGCVFYNNGVGTDPQLYNPHFEHYTKPTTAFNSLVYGSSKGYYTAPESVGEDPLPTARPTEAPMQWPEKDENGESTIVLVNEDFENYNNTDDAIAGGWNVRYADDIITPAVTSTPTPGYNSEVNGPWVGEVLVEAVIATSTPIPQILEHADGSGKYFMDQSVSYITFDPVPVRASSGLTLGPNVRLEVEFDGTMTGGSSGGSTMSFRLAGGDVAALAIGRRKSRDLRYDWGTTSPGSSASSFMVTNAATQDIKNSHIKIVAYITDENGDFIQSGNASVSYNGVTTVAGTEFMNPAEAVMIDRFMLAGGTKRIDNLTIKLIQSESAKEEHTVTLKVDSPTGSVSPEVATVLHGEGKTFAITRENATDVISYIKVNGEPIDTSNIVTYRTNYFQFTLNDIKEDTTVNIAFGVDRSALYNAIEAAKELYATASANIGTEPGQYSQAKVTALNAAIEAAQAVYVKDDATSEELSEQITILNNITKATSTNTPSPTPIPEEAYKGDLNAKIAEAQALYNEVCLNIGDADGQYSHSTVNALLAAIERAQAVSADRWVTQTGVTSELLALATAMNYCVPNGEPTPEPNGDLGPHKVIWKEDFEGQEYDPSLENATQSLVELGWATIGVPTAKINLDGSNKYLSVSLAEEDMGKTPADHDGLYYQFDQVRVSGGALSSNDPGHPGTNAKLTFQYDTKFDLTGASSSSYLYSALMAGDTGYDKNKVFGGIVTKNKSFRYFPYTSSYQSTIGNVADCGNQNWVTIKMVINITDENGNYISTIDTYAKPVGAEEFTYLSTTDLASITASSGKPITAGKYYIAWHNAAATTNVAVDNISIVMTSNEITNDYINGGSTQTPAPTDPTEEPEPTEEPQPTEEPEPTEVPQPTEEPEITPAPSTPAPQDGPYRVIWEEDFDKDKYDTSLANATDSLVGMGWETIGVPVAKFNSVSGNKYLTVSCEDVNKELSPADHDGLYFKFGNVRLTGGALAENDPGHPGTNAKLTVQYDTMFDLTGADKNSYMYSALMAGEGEYDKNRVFGGIATKNTSYRYFPHTDSYQTTIGGVENCGNKSWVTLKMVINITDGDGNYVSTIDTYAKPQGAEEFTFLSSKPLSSITASYGAPVTAGRYYIAWHNAKTTTSVSVDNISIILTNDELSQGGTTTPQPTAEPVVVDKAELKSALVSAQEVYDAASANVGDGEGQYSQALVTALNVAIETAMTVYDNEDADQETVDQAIIDLNAVVATVVPNTAAPTPTPVCGTMEPEPTPGPTQPPVSEVVYGDADGDGEVTVSDATAVLLNVAGALEDGEINLACADADGDGEITVSDATAILLHVAGALDNLGPSEET